MKRSLLLCLGFLSVAATAHAVGVDLSAGACPGNTGASATAGTLDCAGGQKLNLYVTFMPNEAIRDLVGVDMILEVSVQGDLNSTANFWDFATVNVGAITVNRRVPATGCAGYTDAWSPAGGGEGWAALIRTPSALRIAASSYRPTDLGVLPNQRIFGIQFTLDAGTSVEAGGEALGCTTGVCLVASQLNPGSASGATTTSLYASSVFGNMVTFNGGSGSLCFAVPTARHTWGQLKSLYR